MPEDNNELFNYNEGDEEQFVRQQIEKDPNISISDAMRMYKLSKPTKSMVEKARYDPDLRAKILAGAIGVGTGIATGGASTGAGAFLSLLGGLGNAAQTNNFSDIPGVIAQDAVAGGLGSKAASLAAEAAQAGMKPNLIRQLLQGAGINAASVGAGDVANKATDVVAGDPLKSSHVVKSPTEYAIAAGMGLIPGAMNAARSGVSYVNNRVKNWLTDVTGPETANDVVQAMQKRMNVGRPDLAPVAGDVREAAYPKVYRDEERKINAQIAANQEGSPALENMDPEDLRMLQIKDPEKYKKLIGIKQAELQKKQNAQKIAELEAQDFNENPIGYPSKNFIGEKLKLQAQTKGLESHILEKTQENADLQKTLNEYQKQTMLGAGAYTNPDVKAAGNNFVAKLNKATEGDPSRISSDVIANLIPSLEPQELAFMMQRFGKHSDKIKGTLVGNLINMSMDKGASTVNMSKITDAAGKLGLDDPQKLAILFPQEAERKKFTDLVSNLGELFSNNKTPLNGLIRSVPTAGGIYFMLRRPLGEAGAAAGALGYTALRVVPWDKIGAFMQQPEVLKDMVTMQKGANLRSVARFQAIDNFLKKHGYVQDDDLGPNSQAPTPQNSGPINILDTLKNFGRMAIDY